MEVNFLSSSDSDKNFFHYCLLSLLFISLPTFISLRFLQAPYGRFNRKGWGPSISPSLAWFLMESPTIWLTLLIFPFGRHRFNPKAQTLISIYLFHYIHRTCIYPLRLRYQSRRKTTQIDKKQGFSGFPISVALMAFGFNLLNAYLQSRWVSHYADYDGGFGVVNSEWWFWGRFLVGLVVFVSGMVVNVRSDLVLVSLKGEDGGYKIPKGGMFGWVSCANYFGEIVEWFGWTVMMWSWVGFAFFLYTCSNLVPRARANHKWYLDKFKEEYPCNRKIVIPFVY